MTIYIPRACALAAVAAALICAGCGREAPLAFEEPLRRAATVETNVQAMQAWALSRVRADVLVHVGASDEMTVFAPALEQTISGAAEQLARGKVTALGQVAMLIENGGTINLAHRAGLYRRVIWVIPTAGPVTKVSADDFRAFWAEKRGYPPEALADLVAVGKHFSGTIDGVPVTVTALADIELDEGESAILNVDLTYFVGLQGRDPAYQPGTASLLDVLRALRDRRIPAECVTINRSSVRHLVPLDIRYYGEVIGEVLEKPALLDQPVPEIFRLMIEAEENLVAGKFGAAEELYRRLTERRRDSAGLFFAFAVASGFNDRAETCRQALLEAYGLDTTYLRGFAQLARVLGQAGRIETGEYLLETPTLLNIMPAVEINHQRGLFYFGAGKYPEAIRHLEAVASQRPADFAVRTVLVRAYEEVGFKDKLMGTLERLIVLDTARVERDMPWVYRRLGELAEESGLGPRAAEVYARYIELVPDDEAEPRMRSVIARYGKR